MKYCRPGDADEETINVKGFCKVVGLAEGSFLIRNVPLLPLLIQKIRPDAGFIVVKLKQLI